MVHVELCETLNKTLSQLIEFLNQNSHYKIDGAIKNVSLNNHFWDSICNRRRLRRLLNQVINKKSLSRLNKLFHFLHKKELIEKIKISIPKHDEIQKKRKLMIEAKLLYLQTLQDYKLEKGDFYKQFFI